MSVYNLPDDIYDQATLGSPVIFHHYASRTVIFKEKSIMTRNVISLVIEGRKTMQFTEKLVQVNDR
jgi:hypothetical protein